jgi:hypothetical protein
VEVSVLSGGICGACFAENEALWWFVIILRNAMSATGMKDDNVDFSATTHCRLWLRAEEIAFERSGG